MLEHRPSSRQQQRSIRAKTAICSHTDHTTAVGGGHDGSFLISHQQNASQDKASRGVLSILSRRQRGQANA